MLPIGPTHGDRRVARHATAAKTETPGVLALRKCRGYCERVCTGAGKFEDSQVPTHIVGRDCWTGVGDAGVPSEGTSMRPGPEPGSVDGHTHSVRTRASSGPAGVVARALWNSAMTGESRLSVSSFNSVPKRTAQRIQARAPASSPCSYS